jgi:hypothetical protein
MSFFIRKGGGGGAKNSLAGKKRKAAPGQSKAKKGKRRQVNIFNFSHYGDIFHTLPFIFFVYAA